ncbi:DUF397 domain-containing protein [Lipingzhangella sp. LS1_29]|uniref:DUF397 domain-containing protein n=1 Tax=Lipingzhangella rawalii TaxID=2055835 RepID=A0ABU2H7W7_9ACTN|nr:DUF397 domain-containing protein [Lipingzhangella rawalii]MDS1271403.1 DUF397 domain-containing protein [Lipingzhangella rawalii]
MNLFPSDNFRKSSYSDRNNCVEVADTLNASAVRDSQYPDHAVLAFPRTEWRAFLTSVKAERL